ncbi:HTTM domain-containing protein [Streptomyces sp. LP05-1]|uniref:HTTM domain-containing protein n=1 Tax=Streptomyces pyxinae TaxID=2970734 RepID=A0ABT2CE95_9ACTN|nr:HTTM domain-containing protein [Streptomyces sp. LP05-1]MCS0635739.1 HTTM domain-containing protein [Streptomyces sp. LP05-1]
MSGSPGLADAPVRRALDWACDPYRWRYQAAAVRIGMALTWLILLLHEFPRRGRLWGPDAAWSWQLAQRQLEESHAFSVLLWWPGELWFEAFYALSVAVAAALLVGWRTRTMSFLFLICVLSLDHRNEWVLNAGDTVFRLTAVYLVFMRPGRVWSLDARRAGRPVRRDRTGPVLWALCGLVLAYLTLGAILTGGWSLVLWLYWLAHAVRAIGDRHEGTRGTLDLIGDIVHNAAVVMLMIQVCLVYATAGWYKIQGRQWQDGSGVYWGLGLDWLTPFPSLTQLITSHALLVLALSYGTVVLQVAFPFGVFNRRLKNVMLALMFAEHIGIGVLMGLFYFSLSMIVADLVFLPTGFLLGAAEYGRRAVRRARPAVPRRPAGEAAGESGPPWRDPGGVPAKT